MKAIINIGKSFSSKYFMTQEGFNEQDYYDYRQALFDWIKTNVENCSIVEVPGFSVFIAVHDEESDFDETMTEDVKDSLRYQFSEHVMEIVLSF